MGRANNTSPLPVPLTQADFSGWDRENNHCCTKNDFRIDITGFKMSEWNKSAAQVFAEAFLKSHRNFRRSHEQVVDAWLSHVDTLRKTYKRSVRSKADVEKAASRHRQSERKVNVSLYIRRQQTASLYPETRGTVGAMVERLGRNGMSSDESDHGARGGDPTYNIVNKEWRANAVTDWLRTLDALHLRLRYKGAWEASAGAWPHCRSPSFKASSKPAIKGLPRDFYDLNWLNSRTQFRREELCVSNVFGDLTIPPSVAEYANSCFCIVTFTDILSYREAKPYNPADRQVASGHRRDL
ncbi:hypothetical protein BJ138DRAFT_1020316 [Hygrophoropsis aurantiaca]|uniref:Uncharacterized protein n=1 Tax=Hygrophoropsis aurantiaca TaxID=72124 RepID=A0ACB7ZSF2_9AGAM|nr:hypothetical protein BJ138DRAFT_1020316 [Hygrophoropsis aurantiaca]